MVASVMAGGLGMRVLVVEKAKLGGECLHTGCIPSKALLHAAGLAQMMRVSAAAAGLPGRDITREEAAGVLERVRETIGEVQEADATEKLMRDQGVEIAYGSPRFRDIHTLDLDDRTITSDYFLLATGSRPAPAPNSRSRRGFFDKPNPLRADRNSRTPAGRGRRPPWASKWRRRLPGSAAVLLSSKRAIGCCRATTVSYPARSRKSCATKGSIFA